MASKKHSGLVAMAAMVFMVAILAESVVPAVGVMVDGGILGFPRKIFLKTRGNGVCPMIGEPCRSHYDCHPDCACYTAGFCGDWVV